SAVYKSNATGTDTNPTWTYTYDGLGQLTAATDADAGYSYAYTYDTAGNIRSATASGQNGVNKTFSYANAAWPDLLTSVTVGGTTKSIEYQTSESGNLTGNPATYYNGADYTFEWGKGTQLTSATKNSTTTTYAYDMSGVRSSKTVGGTTYTYTTLSGLVMQQTDGTQELYFLYDDSNQPYALVYKSSATAEPLFYYYLLNVQGDVVALMNTSGTVVAEYQYDPWGVPTVMNSSGTVMEQSTFIGNINPLRYRGYYYDTETGFYYLQSRYYDPVIGRFVSADKFASTGQGFIGCNMFAYCGNNPVNMSDEAGTWPRWIKTAFRSIVSMVKFVATSITKLRLNAAKTKPKNLPPKGEAGSSRTLPNPDGTPKQKRWYGPDGKPERDRDYNHPGNMPFPHDHEWKDGVRQPDHLPPDPFYKFSWEPVLGAGLVVASVIGIVWVAGNDVTGVGIADDFLLGPLGGGVGQGIIMIFG
ncbi:MAG: RHS repeat-associated core domain-containing protein, partial [Oscillospiraceae bacterium]|nr:RHS repeat-associated core domain-containing protein [Oscillospiraceae bacterium]